MKMRFLLLAFPFLLLCAGCSNNSEAFFGNAQINTITLYKWLYNDSGSLTGESEPVEITDSDAIKKIAKALDAIIKGKPETPYDKIPSTYQHLTINYADGTTVKVEANTWCGILVGDRHFDCTAEEIEGLMNTLYS